MTVSTDMPTRIVLAWDGPTRLFKWSLVFTVLLAPILRNTGDPTLLAHRLNGYAILTLILFRLFWGFVGGSTARFTFLRGPREIGAYLRGETRFLGHNPVGALMVVALLVAVGLQALAGLCAKDDILIDQGVMEAVVPAALAKWANVYHHYGFRLILVLVAIHVAANFYATFAKDEDLIGAMVTGSKRAAAYHDAPQAQPGSWLVAGICLIGAAALVLGTLATLGASPFR